MIYKKTEKGIFIIILFLCLIVAGFFGNQYKMLFLPINKGLTPEQVIEKEFADYSEYEYIIQDDFLFACIQGKTGYWELKTAIRNENSGFIFSAPGFIGGNASVPEYRAFFARVSESKVLVVTLLRFKSSYAVIIHEMKDQEEIKVYVNDEEIESITPDTADSDYWIYVLKDLSEETEIYCITQSKKFHVTDNLEIEALYKEGR